MPLISALAVVVSPLYQEIDFSSAPARVPEVVQRLSRACAVSLGTATSLANEVLFVSATKTTPRALMDRIAQALDAGWVQHGDSFTLERPANWEQRAAAMRTAYFARMIETDIRKHPGAEMITDKDLIDRARAARELRDREKRMTLDGLNAFQAVTPAGRLLDKIIARVKPDVLARDPEHKVVFSDRPNRMQVALPKLDRLLADFYAEHNRVAVEMEQQVATNRLRWGPDNALDAWKVVDPEKAKLLVVVSPVQGPRITLKVFQSGDLAAYAERQLSPRDAQLPKPAAMAKLTQASLDFLRKREPTTYGGYVLSGDLQPEFRKATQNEFLRFGNEEALFAIAEREMKNLVAVVPDEALFMPRWANEKGEVDLATYELLLDTMRVEKQTEDGWLVFRSAFPTARLSRSLLEQSFKECASEGRLSIGLWGRLMDRDGVRHAPEFAQLMSLGGQPVPTELIYTAYSARFLARLDTARFDALRAGRPLAGDDLTPDLQELAESAVLNDQSLSYRSNSSGSGLRFVAWDRTELFPTGIRDAGDSIKADYQSGGDAFIVAYPANGTTEFRGADADFLGTLWAYSERPELFNGAKSISPERADFFRGSTVNLFLTFDGGTGVALVASFYEVVPDKSKPLTYKDLPADLREGSLKIKKELIENYQRYRKDGGGG